MEILSTVAPTSQHPATYNVTPIRFARLALDLLPRLRQMPALELRVYLELVARCDGWTRRKLALPFVRAIDIAADLGATPRRVRLAIAELCRLRLVQRIGNAHDARGCQYEIAAPDILDGHCDPTGSQWGGVLGSPRITVEPAAVILQDHSDPPDTLLRSRSIDHCQPRSRAGARGAGGPSLDFCPENNFDDLEREIVLLFDPRWRRFGAKLIRRRLTEVRDLAAPELVVSFCKSQLKKPHVQSGEYTPSLALCRDDFVAWLKARERAAPSNSASRSTPPASPRAEKRPPRELADRADAIKKLRAGAPRPQ